MRLYTILSVATAISSIACASIPAQSQNHVKRMDPASDSSSSSAAPALSAASAIRIPASGIGSISAGLTNVGNTCYLNSILQYLYSIDALRAAIISFPVENYERHDQKFVVHLRTLFTSLSDPSLTEVTPDMDLAKAALKLYDGGDVPGMIWRQGNDVGEVLSNVLDLIERAFRDSPNNNNQDLLKNIVSGSLRLVNAPVASTRMNMLSVIIDPGFTLHDSLARGFFARTRGINLQDPAVHIRAQYLEKPPALLQIKLDHTHQAQHFNFDPVLVMDRYLRPETGNNDAMVRNTAYRESLEEIDDLLATLSIPGLTDEDKRVIMEGHNQVERRINELWQDHNRVVYHLVGVIAHIGAHYLVHLRDSTDATRWRTFNDGTVSDIPREEIFGALGGATPIMLLWALQDSSKPSVIKSATGQLKGDLKRGFQMTGGQYVVLPAYNGGPQAYLYLSPQTSQLILHSSPVPTQPQANAIYSKLPLTERRPAAGQTAKFIFQEDGHALTYLIGNGPDDAHWGTQTWQGREQDKGRTIRLIAPDLHGASARFEVLDTYGMVKFEGLDWQARYLESPPPPPPQGTNDFVVNFPQGLEMQPGEYQMLYARADAPQAYLSFFGNELGLILHTSEIPEMLQDSQIIWRAYSPRVASMAQPNAHFVFQQDGNAVIYVTGQGSPHAIWSSQTWRQDGRANVLRLTSPDGEGRGGKIEVINHAGKVDFVSRSMI